MIFDEVALGLRLRGIEETEVEARVHEVLKTCGLYSFRKWPISALSFGQKKRVTIASILVLKPEIIILDEPTAGQDYKTYTDIMNFLDSLQKQGHTIVMITMTCSSCWNIAIVVSLWLRVKSLQTTTCYNS